MQSFTRQWNFLFGFLALSLAVIGFTAANYSSDDGDATRTGVVYAVNQPPDISDQEASESIAAAKHLSNAFRVVSDRVLPSVVTIETVAEAQSMGSSMDQLPPGAENPFRGTPFEEFFRGGPGMEMAPFQFSPQTPRPTSGTGSGVIIDPSGLVMTNNHVVGGGQNVRCTVRLSDGQEFLASKIWTDPKTDIAIIKIDGAENLVPAKLGDSDRVAVGEWVLALGQPFGLESTVTAGIISAKQRGVGINERENFLQTDAAINPGNSGGPLVNLDGEVIGINTAISSRSGSNAGVGFAVPINLARWVGDQLATTGQVRRAYLGVGVQYVNADLAKQLDVKPRSGVVVTMIQPGTPAASAGLEIGDVIHSFAGVQVTTPQELQVAVERAEIGNPHQVEISRNGSTKTLSFVPAEQPAGYGVASSPTTGDVQTPESSGELGLKVGNLTPELAARLGMQGIEGVVVTGITSDSPAAKAGLEPGNVITEVNRQPVHSVDQFAAALANDESGDDVMLLVKTRSGTHFVVLTRE